MKVKLLTLMTSPDALVHPGQVADLDKKQAKDLIKAGFAVEVPQDTRVTAVGLPKQSEDEKILARELEEAKAEGHEEALDDDRSTTNLRK